MSNEDLWQQFDASLRQRAQTFQNNLNASKSEILSNYSAAGRLRSGSTLRELAAAFDKHLLELCRDEFAYACSWNGVDGISENQLRSLTSDYLRDFLNTQPDDNYVSYGGTLRGSEAQAINDLIDGTKAKALSAIRDFEIGVGKPVTVSSPTYVVNAHTIVGGVQQGTIGSTQSNISEISVNDVSEALEQLITELAASGHGEVVNAIRGDVDTLNAQLSKSEPNRTILKEAASSVRTIIEGALGGVIGTAMTPQFNLALAALSQLTT